MAFCYENVEQVLLQLNVAEERSLRFHKQKADTLRADEAKTAPERV
jgi:hypothetical protein